VWSLKISSNWKSHHHLYNVYTSHRNYFEHTIWFFFIFIEFDFDCWRIGAGRLPPGGGQEQALRCARAGRARRVTWLQLIDSARDAGTALSFSFLVLQFIMWLIVLRLKLFWWLPKCSDFCLKKIMQCTKKLKRSALPERKALHRPIEMQCMPDW
jgi:hypothetical protein